MLHYQGLLLQIHLLTAALLPALQKQKFTISYQAKLLLSKH
jgi:hypothetical protein